MTWPGGLKLTILGNPSRLLLLATQVRKPYGLWSFQTGGTKLEIFLPKNQHTQRKLLNFENWVNGEVSKVPKFDQNLTFKFKFL